MKQARRFRVISTALLVTGFLVTGSVARASGPGAGVAVNQPAPNAWFTVPAGRDSIAQFKGRKVMLWLLSTWCSSCQEGLRVLAREQPALQRAGLTVIVVENYRNGGYGGAPIASFVERYGASVQHAPNWVFGSAPRSFRSLYNPRNFPDIYYLIDQRGVVRVIDAAPSATLQKILAFARTH